MKSPNLEARAETEPKPELLIALLRQVLDPQVPLHIGSVQIDSLGQLARLVENTEQSEPALMASVRSGVISKWVLKGCRAGDRSQELAVALDVLGARLASSGREKSLRFALLLLLSPVASLEFARVEVHTPAELAKQFFINPKAYFAELQSLLFDGILDEWVRALRPDHWQGLIEFMENVRLRYIEQKRLGCFCLVWRFLPSAPLTFGGEKFQQPKDLAQWINSGAEQWQLGLKIMRDGWLRAWLVGCDSIDSMVIDQELLALDISDNAMLESVLRLLDPSIARPRMQLDLQYLHFGLIANDKQRKRQIKVINVGRGHLFGEVKLAEYGTGLFVENYLIDGNSTLINVTLKPLSVASGSYRNVLSFQSNGGHCEVQVSYSVTDPPDTRKWWEKMIGRMYD